MGGVLLAGIAGPSAAQEAPKLSDQLIEQLATGLARVAEAGSPRVAAYFTAEPTAQVRAYLEGQGVEVLVVASAPPAIAPPAAVSPPPAPFPATAPPAAGLPGPYGMMGWRVPESKRLIQDFLTGVRQLNASLPPEGPLVIEAFTVDLPGGSIHFRLR
jgi:hypothetical protein